MALARAEDARTNGARRQLAQSGSDHPLWPDGLPGLSCRMPGLSLPASVCPYSLARAQQLPRRAKLLLAPRQHPRPDFTNYQKQPSASSPLATSLKEETRLAGIFWASQPPGLLPQWPTQAPSQLLAVLLTGQAHPMTTEGTKKRSSRATDLHCHPMAACGTAQRPQSHAGFTCTESTFNPCPLKEITKRSWQRRCLH